jgi:hypothetical protein
MEPWNPGTLEPWNPGTLEPWNPGTLEPWNPGTLEPKSLFIMFICDLNRRLLSLCQK